MPDAMLEELQSILRAIKNPHLLALAEASLPMTELMNLLKQAPGAKTIPSSLFKRFARAYAVAAQADPDSRRELSRHRRRSLADRRLSS